MEMLSGLLAAHMAASSLQWTAAWSRAKLSQLARND